MGFNKSCYCFLENILKGYSNVLSVVFHNLFVYLMRFTYCIDNFKTISLITD
ncbi:hypothetical protein MBAV_003016 [Candidatus Magnetobacterium bavaricum]|uniref:Uncharacterized protein n=1 Tax=Candidatus Magnetobacterium bavaricum TaxID=29290 RepID=A0A0F3GSA4_9BACT|nr:hypothetical protein MBAV_003016 [Candidatus Magnetobacterium bavaricum]